MALSFEPTRVAFAINRGAVEIDIDSAFLLVMCAIGQTDGGSPALFVDGHSFTERHAGWENNGWDNAEAWRETWPHISVEARASCLRAYVEWESANDALDATEDDLRAAARALLDVHTEGGGTHVLVPVAALKALRAALAAAEAEG